MKSKKGFTLIELLVVVLIIGILAAIALPQYQKAVSKAELQEGIIQARALIQAEEEYALTNGNFTTDLEALSLNFPNNKWACGASFCQYQSGLGFSLEISLAALLIAAFFILEHMEQGRCFASFCWIFNT